MKVEDSGEITKKPNMKHRVAQSNAQSVLFERLGKLLDSVFH